MADYTIELVKWRRIRVSAVGSGEVDVYAMVIELNQENTSAPDLALSRVVARFTRMERLIY